MILGDEQRDKMLEEIHAALCGSLNGTQPGLFERVNRIEGFIKGIKRVGWFIFTLLITDVGLIVVNLIQFMHKVDGK